MVPDKFNMVDMEGIDLIESQGVEVPGLYEKLVESIALCQYQCLYNWSFNGVLIPPSYVEMEVRENAVWINEGVSVDENDVVHVNVGCTPIEPVIESIEITENGTYAAPTGTDGYSPVIVDVASSQPVIESITITENGTYAAPAGTDGYSPVIVDVASSQPVIESITITENGTYAAPVGTDGYSPVIVNVASSGIDSIQSNIQVSSTSAYMRYSFETQMEFETFDCVMVTLSENNSVFAAGAVKYTSGNAQFRCSDGTREYSMRISNSYIECFSYTGSYRNIYANIYGIKF